MKNYIKQVGLGLLLTTLPIVANAKVQLPAYFTDNMVLQQNRTLTISGTAKAKRNVTLITSWDNNSYRTKAAPDGTFSIEIQTPPAGGPYTMIFTDGEKLTLNNVMVGEVWLCSGQSNMEMPMAGWGQVMNYKQEIADANYPNIRLLQIRKNTDTEPAREAIVNNEGWQPCTPKDVEEFSSVAYFFARQLWNELNVPIGVIDCTWGGTPAEAWVSAEALAQMGDFDYELNKMQTGLAKDELLANYNKEITEWTKLFEASDAGSKKGQPSWASTTWPLDSTDQLNVPGYWEKQQLANLDGIVWYQKKVNIPSSWSGKPITLSLGTIDDDDTTYFDGKEIGSTVGYNINRRYTIPAQLVKAGNAAITVRVVDTQGDGGIYGDPDNIYMECDGQRISLTGTWNYRIGLDMSEDMDVMPISPNHSGHPAVLYNGMVYPLITFPLQGVIWYQGESNVGREKQYSTLFKTLINDWREKWGTNLPFYFVQISAFMEPQAVQPASQWAYLREAQADALRLDNTGMVVSTDIGDADDIHPKNKQEVGRRLALNALNKTYHKPVMADAPIMTNYSIEGAKILLHFNQPLEKPTNALKGFILAQPNGQFVEGVAEWVNPTTLAISAPGVTMPMAVRYNWSDCPEGNLFGTDGLPVAPFRTDRY